MSCLLWVVVCLKDFKAFKCMSLNANIPFGFLTPPGPFESSNLGLFLFYSCQAPYNLQRNDRVIFLHIKQLIRKAKKAAEGEMNLYHGRDPGTTVKKHTQKKSSCVE